jgi:hypothetical protein
MGSWITTETVVAFILGVLLSGMVKMYTSKVKSKVAA